MAKVICQGRSVQRRHAISVLSGFGRRGLMVGRGVSITRTYSNLGSTDCRLWRGRPRLSYGLSFENRRVGRVKQHIKFVLNGAGKAH